MPTEPGGSESESTGCPNLRAICIWCVIGVLGFFVLTFIGWHFYQATHASEYRRYNSPDKNFSVVVYSYPMLISAIGGNGDASGFVRLESTNGTTLFRHAVPRVASLDFVDWTTTNVDVASFFTWTLPQKMQKQSSGDH